MVHRAAVYSSIVAGVALTPAAANISLLIVSTSNIASYGIPITCPCEVNDVNCGMSSASALVSISVSIG